MEVAKKAIKFPKMQFDGESADAPVIDLQGNELRTVRSYIAESLQAIRIEASRAARCRDLAIKIHQSTDELLEFDKSDYDLIRQAIEFAGTNIWPAWITAAVLDAVEEGKEG